MIKKDNSNFLIKYSSAFRKFLKKEREKLGFLLIDVPEFEEPIKEEIKEDPIDPKLKAINKEVLEALQRLEQMDIET